MIKLATYALVVSDMSYDDLSEERGTVQRIAEANRMGVSHCNDLIAYMTPGKELDRMVEFLAGYASAYETAIIQLRMIDELLADMPEPELPEWERDLMEAARETYGEC